MALASTLPTLFADEGLSTLVIPWGSLAGMLALAVIVLIWDMMRRIRRGRVRADINEELDAQEQAAAATRATEVDDQDVDAGGGTDRLPGGGTGPTPDAEGSGSKPA